MKYLVALTCWLTQTALAFGGVAVVLVAPLACNDKDKRMSEFETLEYKKQLLRRHHEGLTHEQQMRLMQHPARRQVELDEALEEYRESFQRAQERERTLWLESRERVAGAERPKSLAPPQSTSPVEEGAAESVDTPGPVDGELLESDTRGDSEGGDSESG